MLRLHFSFLLLLISTATSQSQENYLYFDQLTTEDGLSNDRVSCVLQDQQGFMWFGTDNGLNKYDGYKFTVYTNDSTISPNLTGYHVISLFEDRAGRLWIGTWEGLNVFELKNNKIYHFRNNPDVPNSLAGNWIKCIYGDSRGNIWIGTKNNGISFLDHSLLITDKIDTNISFVNYVYNPADTTSLAVNNINSICEDSSGFVWIGTQGAGLNRFDPVSKTFKRFGYQEYVGLSDAIIRKIWREPDSKRNILWIATQHNFNHFDITSNKTTTYPFDRYIHDGFVAIQKLNEHTFWLGSMGKGIYLFDKEEGSIARIHGQPSNPGRMNNTWINDIYKDKCGRTWIASFGGIYKFDPMGHKFPFYRIEVESPEGRKVCAINYLIEERNSKSSTIWLATAENGIVRFDRKSGKAESIAGQITKIIYCGLLQDPDQPEILWTATWGAGLIKGNQRTGKAEQYSFHGDFNELDPNARETFFNNTLSRQVIKDSKGNIWQATSGGLFKINPKSKNFTVYLADKKKPDNISSRNVMYILEDHDQKLWIGTFDDGLNCLDPETGCFTHYKHDPDNECSLDQDYISTLYEDRSGTLWVGTGHILHRFNREENCFIRYKIFPGLVKGILEDDNGYLWISTSKGISKFDPVSKALRNYDVNDGLQDNRFNTRAAFKGQDGEFFFGGPKGFNAFYPDEIVENPFAPDVVLTDFQIFNKSIIPGKNSPLNLAVSHTKEIVLNYNQSVLSFEFSALDYSAPLKNQFAYQMEGVDPEWVYTDAKRRFATYTQLSPGQYIFRVKASNNDDVWNEEGISVTVIILPPWWRTAWAYISYIFIFGALIYALRGYDQKRQRLKHQLALEHEHAENLQEIDRMKSRFFANISHEFRTPLTLILGPIKKWLPQLRNHELKQDLHLMLRSANSLYRLINQLLDLSRLESGGMTLQAREENIVQMLRGYVQSFESLARIKKINLDFAVENESILVHVDHDKLEKIMYNLLSNAFKFTPEGGKIIVDCGIRNVDLNIEKDTAKWDPVDKIKNLNSKFLEIFVSNTGSYIPADKIDLIFDRFYQADDSMIRGHEGSGIGLALTRELVELHHGKITVESTINQGTIFSVSLPMGNKHLNEQDLRECLPASTYKIDSDLLYETETVTKVRPKIGEKTPLIMVVEDNKDVRFYIRGHLDSAFRIIEASDGKEGLETAIEKIPDLIISDVMMPGMDGFELCQKLKTDERTSHIPVILLTARATTEDKIGGLETGADDYLTKPFDAQELRVRINNLIAQREKLRNHYLKTFNLETSLEGVTSADKNFMAKLTAIIDSHLAEPGYSIASFSREVGFSHSQLIRKIESLTGLPPSHFIRARRLRHARHLLDQKAGNISQIAYDCGFNNISYFSRSFKDQFGQLPSEYIKGISM